MEFSIKIFTMKFKGKEEFYMNKKICVSIIIALIMIVTLATSVLAANEEVTLVKVKDNVCTIKLGEDGEVIKQLISVDNEKKEVTLQIDVKT